MKIDLFKLMDGFKGSEAVGILKRTLRDDDLVLEAVVDYAQRRRERNVDNNKIAEILMAAADCVWTRWCFIYSRCRHPENIFESPKFRRQSQRFLNLAANFVTELLEEEPGFDGEPCVPADRLQLAGLLTASLQEKTARANGSHEHYRHPDAPRWLRLHAQYNRRVAKALIASARNEERQARYRATSLKLSSKVSEKSEKQSDSWQKVDWMGFDIVSTSEDGAWHEVYLPPGWYHEQDPSFADGEAYSLVDDHGNVRADYRIDADGQPGEIHFRNRFEVVEEEHGDKVIVQILDRLRRKSTFSSDKIDRSDVRAVAEARVHAQLKADAHNASRSSYSRGLTRSRFEDLTDTFHR